MQIKITMRSNYSILHNRLGNNSRYGRGKQQGVPSYTAGENIKMVRLLWKMVGQLHKWLSNNNHKYKPSERKMYVPPQSCMFMFIATLLYSGHQVIKDSIGLQMRNRRNVACLHNRILLRENKEWGSEESCNRVRLKNSGRKLIN